jgi:hypothetical protein
MRSKLFLFFSNALSYLIKQSLRMWCEEYIRRIDQNFGKELRT